MTATITEPTVITVNGFELLAALKSIAPIASKDTTLTTINGVTVGDFSDSYVPD